MKKKQPLEEKDYSYIQEEINYICARFEYLGKVTEFMKVTRGVYRGLYEGLNFSLKFHEIDKHKKFIYWFKFTDVKTSPQFKVGLGVFANGGTYRSNRLECSS